MNENPASAAPTIAPTPASPLDLPKVALGQRIIIASMVLVVIAIGLDYTSFGATPSGKLTGSALSWGSILVSIGGSIFLGRALRLPIWAIVVAVICMFIGIVNLITLAILNDRAMKALKPAGYKVGFFGSSKPS